MEENRIQLSVLNIESKYVVSPDETTYGNKNLVTWGMDNQLPVLYHNCYNKSATLKAIIDGTINYILGDDIVLDDSAAYWREKVNRNGLTMRQLVSKMAFNLNVYGGIAIQVIFNKLGQVVELFPLDFGRCRTNEDGTKIYYAKKWTKYQTKSQEFDRFDPKNINKDNPTQIFYYKNDTTNSVYPLPPYAGALYDVLTEIECAKYSLNTVARGFSAKYILNLPEAANSMTDEQKHAMEEAIKEKFCGSENESNFLMYYRNGDSDADKLEITKIESDETPERYIAIKDNARTNIFVAMRTTPLLMGLVNGISTGWATQEFSDSFKLFQKTVIKPQQDIIVEALEKITGAKNGIHIIPFEIDFGTQE